MAKLPWWKNWKVMVPLWAALLAVVWVAAVSDVDVRVIAGGFVVVGLVTNAFAWLLGIIALVPVVGPLVATALTAGFLLLLNGIGAILSFIAAKRGYGREMLTYRGVTLVLIIGVIIGFVLGKLAS
jgi:hypothetical protein